MTIKEKELYVTELFKKLMALQDINDPVVQGVSFFSQINEFIDSLYEKGRIEGFQEGYKEAKKKLEQQQTKLN